jgi:hypothetical protein
MGMIEVYKSEVHEAKALLTFGIAVRMQRVFWPRDISLGQLIS